ncbi:CAPM protein (capM2) [Rickettsia prowazekii str. GvV257]|uniref:glycosyltransferase family 4 protein n=1 Tax=Rickettsia prowazekii TaxID=782 RepID=UPI000256BE25|nr:glycosyltransferase family 4 protein [Rickettsia prowazekii]AFE52850.1 CAPM protein (capM2) [Rickettsia prowazekii str. GvV257]
MKILNIMLSRDLGGIQQAFLDYNAALEIQKIEVINVTSYRAKINSLLHKRSFKLINLLPIDPLSVLILKYIIYKTKPDIIIAHGNRSINFSKLAKPHNTKLIGIAHNYSLKGLRKCDFAIALTYHMKEFLLKNNFAESKIFILPNMINITKNFVQNKIYKKVIVIGVLARFVAKKGIDVFIKAIKLLKDKQYNIQVVIGGNGNEKDNLIALVHKLNLQDQISFTGWVNDKDTFFKQIDIFCLPSLHEPFGIIILEAMQASVPIVSTDTEGPKEILKHLKDGLICKVGSIEDLAEKIIYLIDNPLQAAKFSKNAYLKLKQNYDIKVVSKKLQYILKNFR